MYDIKLLSHTADVRVHLTSDTLEELFKAGIISISNMLIDGICDREEELSIVRQIKVTSFDTTTLLVDFLSDVLTLGYNEKAVFCRLKITHLEQNSINAHIFGKSVPEYEEDIKAITYHEAEVRKNQAGQWETLLIYDI